MIPRKIYKVGNSYGVTIPVSILRYIKAGPGDYVDLSVTENRKVLIQKREGQEPSREEKKGYETEKKIFVPGPGWVPKY